MEPITKITISCQGATNIALESLHDLQGSLKDLTEENYIKLRNSIIEYGFSFPIFFWEDQEGRKWTIDSHQRQRTLKKMQEEGIQIPLLPADPIFAKDKIEAKKKLLLLNSRFGKITQEGFDEFIGDPEAPILEEELADILEIDEIKMIEEDEVTTSSEEHPEKKQTTCPQCGHAFTP